MHKSLWLGCVIAAAASVAVAVAVPSAPTHTPVPPGLPCKDRQGTDFDTCLSNLACGWCWLHLDFANASNDVGRCYNRSSETCCTATETFNNQQNGALCVNGKTVCAVNKNGETDVFAKCCPLDRRTLCAGQCIANASACCQGNMCTAPSQCCWGQNCCDSGAACCRVGDWAYGCCDPDTQVCNTNVGCVPKNATGAPQRPWTDPLAGFHKLSRRHGST